MEKQDDVEEIIIENKIDKNYIETYVSNMSVKTLEADLFKATFYEITDTEPTYTKVYSNNDNSDEIIVRNNEKYNLNSEKYTFLTENDKLSILVSRNGLENIKKMVDRVLADLDNNDVIEEENENGEV